jgi:hypothetical protein
MVGCEPGGLRGHHLSSVTLNPRGEALLCPHLTNDSHVAWRAKVLVAMDCALFYS